MGIRFDTYLVDEVTSVGDAIFRRKSEEVFQQRIGESAAIFCSHSMPMVRRLCTQGAVLEDGMLTWYTDIDAAIAHHERNMGGA
jgi:capsular polysaccharide transport system ATP-binding protein